MANPFGQMKDLYKMQREAKKMQAQMREKIIKGESKDGRIVLTMNAAQEFIDIHIDESLLNPEAMGTIKTGMKQAFKDYLKKMQKAMMADMDMDKLKGMLGQ